MYGIFFYIFIKKYKVGWSLRINNFHYFLLGYSLPTLQRYKLFFEYTNKKC
jgi:hypothetical protein